MHPPNQPVRALPVKPGLPFIEMALLGVLPSALKVMIYRLRGATIGKRVRIGLGSIIQSRDVRLDDDARIGAFSFLKARKVRLGKRAAVRSFVAVDTGELIVGDDSTIMEQVVVGGMLTPRSRLEIGKRVKVFAFSFLNPTEPIVIEDDVGVGGANYIFTHGSWQSLLDGYPVSFGPVTIKRGVWLPWRVFIMPGVTIGEFATIGAGSIVTRDIPARSLAVGSPAKAIKSSEQYVKPLSPDARHAEVQKILAEFAEYLRYQGHAVEFLTTDAGCKLKFSAEASVDVIRYERILKQTSGAREIGVSLEKIGEDAMQSYRKGTNAWFCLATKACRYSRTQLWSETRNFFSRYGERFDVQEGD